MEREKSGGESERVRERVRRVVVVVVGVGGGGGSGFWRRKVFWESFGLSLRIGEMENWRSIETSFSMEAFLQSIFFVFLFFCSARDFLCVFFFGNGRDPKWKKFAFRWTNRAVFS